MIEDIGYPIILLSRVMDLPIAGNLNIFMVHFIKTIKKVEMTLDWASTFNENLCEYMVVEKSQRKFYMTSYLVYVLAARAIDYPRLYKRGSIQDPNAWPYIVYPHLVKKGLSE